MAAVGHQPQLPSQKQRNSTHPVTQLEFHQAMTDFKTMFPEMDEDVIEVILRANNGAVDATIDQLLSMSTDNENERLRAELDATENDELPPSYSPATPPPSYHQAVPYAHSPGRSLMAPLSRNRKTSGSSPSLMRHMQLLNQRLPSSQALPTIARIPPPKKEKEEPDTNNSNCAPLRYQRKWNPPLVGPLPATFLRLDDRQHKPKRGKFVTVLSSAVLQKRMKENERQRRNTIGAEDPELAQYLEDERIALFLQNEEFVQELMGNKEFMSSLEKDASNNGTMTLQSRQSQAAKGAELKHSENLNCPKSEDRAQLSRSLSGDDSDAAFRERLKNMGKTSRRKFAQLASIFSRRKRPFKPILGDGSNPSRDNLLLTEDEYAQLSEEDSDTDWNKKDSWNSHHGEPEENSKLEHSKSDNT